MLAARTPQDSDAEDPGPQVSPTCDEEGEQGQGPGADGTGLDEPEDHADESDPPESDESPDEESGYED